MTPLSSLSLLLFSLLTLTLPTTASPTPQRNSTTPNPPPPSALPVYPLNSTCFCTQRSPQDYTISLWILSKRTPSLSGPLSQGLQDNFATFCKGYYSLWSDTVPLVTNQAALTSVGDTSASAMSEEDRAIASSATFPAEVAPQTLGAKVDGVVGVDLVVTGYVVGLDLEGKGYDGCLSEVVERAEGMGVSCDCGG